MINGRQQQGFGGPTKNEQQSLQDPKQPLAERSIAFVFEENKKLNIICKEQQQTIDDFKGLEEDMKRKIRILLDENTKLNQALLQNAKLASNYNDVYKENQNLRHELDELRNFDPTSVINDLTQKLDLLLADNENLDKTLNEKLEDYKKQAIINEQQTSHIFDLQREVKELTSYNNKVNNQLNNKMKEIETSEAEIRYLKDQLKEQNANDVDTNRLVDSLKKQLADKVNDIDLYKKQLADKVNDIDSYKKQLADKVNDSDLYKNQIEEKSDFIKKLQEENEDKNEEINMLKLKADTLEKQKYEKEKKSSILNEQNYNDRLNQELSKLSQELKDVLGENSKLKKNSDKFDEFLRTVEQKLAEMASENEKINIQLHDRLNILNHTINERDSLLKQASELKNELNNLYSRLDFNQQKIKDQDQRIKKLENTVLERHKDIDNLQAKIVNLEQLPFKIKELEDRIVLLISENELFRKMQIDSENLKNTALKIPELEYKIKFLTDDNERLHISLSEKTKEIDSLKPVVVTMHALEDQISLLVQENDKIITLLEAKTDEIQKLERKLERYADNEAKLLQEKEALFEEIDDWRVRLSKLDQSQIRIKELEKIIRQRIEENEYLTDQVTEKVAEAERVRKRLRDIEKLQKRITDLEDNNKFFHRENEELKSEIKDHHQEFELFKTRYHKLEARQSKYADIEVKYNKLREEWQDLRMEYELRIRDINDYNFNKQQALESELSALKLEKMRWETSNHETTNVITCLKNQVAELEINLVKAREMETIVDKLNKEKNLLVEKIAELNNAQEEVKYVNSANFEEQIQGLSNENSHMRTLYENSLKEIEVWRLKYDTDEQKTYLFRDSEEKINLLANENLILKTENNNILHVLAELTTERDKLKLDVQNRYYENEHFKAVSSSSSKSHMLYADQTPEIDLLKAQLANYQEIQSANVYLSNELDRLKSLLQQSDKLGYHLKSLEDQIEQMVKENKELVNLLTIKDKDIADINNLFSQEQSKYSRLDELDNAIGLLSAENDKLNNFVQERNKQLQILKNQQNALEDENQMLKANNPSNNNSKLKIENEELKKRINEMQSKYAAYDPVEIKNLKSQIIILQKQLEEKLLELENLKTKLNIFEKNKNTIAEFQNHVSMLNTEIEKLTLENEKLKANQNLNSVNKNFYDSTPEKFAFTYRPQPIISYGLENSNELQRGQKTPNSSSKNRSSKKLFQ